MAKSAPTRGKSVASPEELRNLLGHIDPETAVKVLELSPTIAELEEVSMWLTGQGNVPERAGHPLEGRAAAIYEMLAADERDQDR
jgi:hypothetical protein